METKKPIKRNAAIVAFSKDHHFALLLVWKIKEGLKNLIEPHRITEYVIHFYDTDLIQHFKDEEEFLFSKLSADNPLRIQAETEHKTINNLIQGLRTNSGDKNSLEKFAATLEKHIRFEERELFNELQQILSDEDLIEIASINSREHESDTEWGDVFWKVRK